MRLRAIGPSLSIALATSACGVLLGSSGTDDPPTRPVADGGSGVPIDGSGDDDASDATPPPTDGGADARQPTVTTYTWDFDSPPSDSQVTDFGFDDPLGTFGGSMQRDSAFGASGASLVVDAPNIYGEKKVGAASRVQGTLKLYVDKSPTMDEAPRIVWFYCGISPIFSVKLDNGRQLFASDEIGTGTSNKTPALVASGSFALVAFDASLDSTAASLSVSASGSTVFFSKGPVACAGPIAVRIGLLWSTFGPLAGTIRVHYDDISLTATVP